MMIYSMNKMHNAPKCDDSKNDTNVDYAIVWALGIIINPAANSV